LNRTSIDMAFNIKETRHTPITSHEIPIKPLKT
jgi:hypothetical protein